MNRQPLVLSLSTVILLALPTTVSAQQQVYKWTDASGRVHYGERKPENTEQVRTLDITPSATPTSTTDGDSEIARINALSQQMASEREAAEKARQEQRLLNLQLENQRLKNDLLSQQVEQQQREQKNDDPGFLIGYPTPYYPVYPYPPTPYPPKPPRPWPCQPWPGCRPSPALEPPPRPHRPVAKPNPPFNPTPVGIAPPSKGVFKGR
ncbi:MAG: DUF4124 domain-containing protein [Candidatus Competibacteraceae bacterium]|nr:DUF4124 domain-containing protein [Candidatus Competibacteraceae bacterium]